MRYLNHTSTARFSTLANRTVRPGMLTPPLRPLLDAFSEIATRSGGMLAVLDRDDVAAIMRLVESTRKARAILASGRPRPRRPEDELAESIERMGDIGDARDIARQAIVSEGLRRDEEIRALRESEDSEIDSEGRVVKRDSDLAANRMAGIDASAVEPRLHADGDGPLTAEGVVAHNKAVSHGVRPPEDDGVPTPVVPPAGDRSSPSDSTPVSGAEAVSRRVVPGVPDLPGLAAPGGLYESVNREMSSRPPPGVPRWDAPKIPPRVSTSGIELDGYPRSDRIQEEAAARNYGRKP